jgi:hypothetical protein
MKVGAQAKGLCHDGLQVVGVAQAFSLCKIRIDSGRKSRNNTIEKCF